MPEFTTESAREAGRKGGLAAQEKRAQKAALRADLRAKATFEQHSEQMAKVIIDAALGQGDFSRLEPKDRAGFALKALEYGVGRPRAVAPDAAPEATASGLVFAPPLESSDG